MKSSLKLLVAISILSLGFTSYSTDFGADGMATTSKDILRLGPFKQGNFIHDEKPLRDEDTRDLREVALSLPIWESSWKESEEWIYKHSEEGRRADEWTNPADGAQHAVTIRRLKESPEGRTRVEVHHPYLKIFTPDGGRYYPWVAVLERGEGGWFVEDANKKEG